MAAGDLVQIGDVVEMAAGDLTFGSFEVQRYSHGDTAEIQEVRDLRGTPTTKIISNPGQTFTLSAVIQDPGGSATLDAFEALKKGDIATLNTGGTKGARTDEAWFVTDRRINADATPMTVEIDVVREDHLAGVATVGYDALVADIDLTA